MKRIALPLFLTASLFVHGQDQIRRSPEVAPQTNAVSIASIKAELEVMLETDQTLRLKIIELEKTNGPGSPEVKDAWARQTSIDAQNIKRLEEIIDRVGWPGTTQFGSKASSAAFLVLQHSDLSYQKKYLSLARSAVEKGEMRGSSLALLEDRIRLREGQKQIYGSQVKENGAGEWEPLPLEDEEKVDIRRASVGLKPISEYLQGFADRSGGRVSAK